MRRAPHADVCHNPQGEDFEKKMGRQFAEK